MGSPLVFGGFNGWTVVGDRLSYTVGRAGYDDFLVRGSWAALVAPGGLMARCEVPPLRSVLQSGKHHVT